MEITYKVHPAIGIARLGNSPDSFYLAPETAGGLPIEVTPDGNAKVTKDGAEQPIDMNGFRDVNGLIRRQAARFRVLVYDDQSPQGRELKIGDEVIGSGTKGKLVDIKWTAYLANKKAVWYEFTQLEGEHGYDSTVPLRNAGVTVNDARQALIIDPGPQSVSFTGNQSSASFANGQNPGFAQTFPPAGLQPNEVTTLGDLRVTKDKDGHMRLLLLGGHGNSGSTNTPLITSYANNDGWFDDISDGPVTATLIFEETADGSVKSPVQKQVPCNEQAWCVVGYPRYAPQITDMITTDDLLYDLNVRMFGYNPYLYGTKPFTSTAPLNFSDPAALQNWRNRANQYNPDFYPYFYRDIWPILMRPYNMQYTTDILAISNAAHETQIEPGDFYVGWMSVPPDKETGIDKFKDRRWFVFSMLRRPGEENQYTNHHVRDTTVMYNKELMPLLCGDNPITNTLPSKFLRLTDTMLFMLSQWAKGKFINEKLENIPESQVTPPPGSGEAIDRGVLANMLGGAFCPGAETCWIIRNPAIFAKPYRINANTMFTGPITGMTGPLSQQNPISAGLEPGDITKYSGIPWQSDFNECSTQDIDITYDIWNVVSPGTTGDNVLAQMDQDTQVLWWPSHRPMEVYQPVPVRDPKTQKITGYNYLQIEWARGIQQTHAGDLKMVTEWSKLGFLISNPYVPGANMSLNGTPAYVQVAYTGNVPMDWSLVKPA